VAIHTRCVFKQSKLLKKFRHTQPIYLNEISTYLVQVRYMVQSCMVIA